MTRMKQLVLFTCLYMAMFSFGSFAQKSQVEIPDNKWLQLKMADIFLDELHYDSAEYYYSGVIEYFRAEKNWKIYCAAANNYIKTLWRNEKYDFARKNAYQNLDYCIEHLGKDHPETARTYLNLGILSFLTGHSGITHEYCVKALDILAFFIYQFTNLGNVHNSN